MSYVVAVGDKWSDNPSKGLRVNVTVISIRQDSHPQNLTQRARFSGGHQMTWTHYNVLARRMGKCLFESRKNQEEEWEEEVQEEEQQEEQEEERGRRSRRSRGQGQEQDKNREEEWEEEKE